MKYSTISMSAALFAVAFSGYTPAGAILQRAAVIRPTPDELRWREIPWMTSLAEAQTVASREKRPLFVWTDDDDPLDRC